MKSPTLLKIESHFNLPFPEIISKLHWEKEYSVKRIADESGVSRDFIQKQAKRMGLEVRNRKQATSITKNKGENHWAYGLNKESSEWAKRASERMTENNPIRDESAANKRAKTIEKTFKKKLYPQEAEFAKVLDSLGIAYEMQKPFGRFNVDFFIPDMNLAIEIDSTDKWGKERREKAALRDTILSSDEGIEVLRINKKIVFDRESIIYFLKRENVIS